jgi:hypothetical protein
LAHIKFAAPIMRRQGAGSVINIGSVAGHRAGYSSSLIYAVAKAAVIHMSRCAAMELGDGLEIVPESTESRDRSFSCHSRTRKSRFEGHESTPQIELRLHPAKRHALAVFSRRTKRWASTACSRCAVPLSRSPSGVALASAAWSLAGQNFRCLR